VHDRFFQTEPRPGYGGLACGTGVACCLRRWWGFKRSASEADSDARTHADTDPHPDAHTNADTDSDANPVANSHTNAGGKLCPATAAYAGREL